VGWVGIAQAESVVYTDAEPTVTADLPYTLTFNQFDPNLGILTGVEISLTGAISGSVRDENLNATGLTININVEATLGITPPNNSLLVAGGNVANVTHNAGPFDNVIDFAGTSGATNLFSVAVANQATYNATPDLLPFIGTGQINLPLRLKGSFTASGGTSNVIIALLTQGRAAGTIRYIYTIPQIEIKKLTNNFDADGANDLDVPQIAPGSPVTWTYLVTNTGSITIPLTSVVVTDNQPGITPTRVSTSDVNGDNLLSPDETWIYQAIGTAANLDTPPPNITLVAGCNPGGAAAPGDRVTYRNIGTVIVPGATDTDPSHYCNPPAPGITIQKLTNNFDANNPNDLDVPQIVGGATVIWTYLVTNTGNITFALASVTVADSQPGVTPIWVASSDANGDSLLSPGETWLYTASATAQNLATPTAGSTIVAGCNPGGTAAPGDRATYRNIGTVIVPGATANDPSHYCNPPVPGIVIQKLTNNFDANNPNDADVPQLQPGTPVVWTYVVTNTGNITFALGSVSVTDSQPDITPTRINSSDVNGDNLLAPGETWIYQASQPAQNLNAPTGGITVVSGCNPAATTVPGDQATYFNIGSVTVPGASDDDPSHYCNPPLATINLEKTVYKGHNNGGFCPGGELAVDQLNKPVTYLIPSPKGE